MLWKTWGMIACIAALSLIVCLILIKLVRGPGFGHRILGFNMLGTVVLAITAVLAVLLELNYLLDVSLILASLNVLTVAVVCSMKKKR